MEKGGKTERIRRTQSKQWW